MKSLHRRIGVAVFRCLQKLSKLLFLNSRPQSIVILAGIPRWLMKFIGLSTFSIPLKKVQGKACLFVRVQKVLKLLGLNWMLYRWIAVVLIFLTSSIVINQLFYVFVHFRPIISQGQWPFHFFDSSVACFDLGIW